MNRKRYVSAVLVLMISCGLWLFFVVLCASQSVRISGVDGLVMPSIVMEDMLKGDGGDVCDSLLHVAKGALGNAEIHHDLLLKRIRFEQKIYFFAAVMMGVIIFLLMYITLPIIAQSRS
jgi:hypothetical protein